MACRLSTHFMWQPSSLFVVFYAYKHLLINNQGDVFMTDAIDILSENEIRYFWVTWDGAAIRIGGGQAKGDPRTLLSTYTPSEFRDVNAVGLSTVDSTGTWEWEARQGRTHNMMTSSNGNFFRVTGPLCGEFTGPSEFPTQRPVTRSFDVFFDLRLNKRLSKQPWG